MDKEGFLKTCVLKVRIHCEACKHKVKKILRKIDGVYIANFKGNTNNVVVSGEVGPEDLIKHLYRHGKYAELVPYSAPEPEPKDNNKKGKGKGQKGKNAQLPNPATASIEQQLKALGDLTKMASGSAPPPPPPNKKSGKISLQEIDEDWEDDFEGDFDHDDDGMEDVMPLLPLNMAGRGVGGPVFPNAGQMIPGLGRGAGGAPNPMPNLGNLGQYPQLGKGVGNGGGGNGNIPVPQNMGAPGGGVQNPNIGAGAGGGWGTPMNNGVANNVGIKGVGGTGGVGPIGGMPMGRGGMPMGQGGVGPVGGVPMGPSAAGSVGGMAVGPSGVGPMGDLPMGRGGVGPLGSIQTGRVNYPQMGQILGAQNAPPLSLTIMNGSVGDNNVDNNNGGGGYVLSEPHIDRKVDSQPGMFVDVPMPGINNYYPYPNHYPTDDRSYLPYPPIHNYYVEEDNINNCSVM